MINVKRLLKEIHDTDTVYPRDIFNFYYLEFVTGRYPEVTQTPYGKEVVGYYLQQLRAKYVRLFRKLLYSQLMKYLQRSRIDPMFDKGKLKTDAPTADLKDLMAHTFRSDMTRRNVVWNAVAGYADGLDSATSPRDIFVNINGLNNAIHNTGGRIIDDPMKVPNYRELRDAFNTVDKIKNENQWSLIKGMVDKDIRELMNQDIPIAEVTGNEYSPPRPNYDNPDDELNIALKQPFTALDYALRYGPNPRKWAVIKGSPFENQYVRKFGPQVR